MELLSKFLTVVFVLSLYHKRQIIPSFFCINPKFLLLNLPSLKY